MPELSRGIQPFVTQLAGRLLQHKVEVVCGPLVEGAFIALLVSLELGCDFVYAERFANVALESLFPVEYRLPGALHSAVKGKRVAIVNDVISAGSAVRGAAFDLQATGADVVSHWRDPRAWRYHFRVCSRTPGCPRTSAADATQFMDTHPLSAMRRRQTARKRRDILDSWANLYFHQYSRRCKSAEGHDSGLMDFGAESRLTFTSTQLRSVRRWTGQVR